MKVFELTSEEYEELGQAKDEVVKSKRRLSEVYARLCAKYGPNAASSDDLRYLVVK